MSRLRRSVVLTAACAAAATWSCGAKPKTPARGPDVVVLLADPGDGAVGRADVSNPAGKVELTAVRESTSISPNQAPTAVTVMSEAAVTRLFGSTLSSLPPAPRHFILYFRFESEELTDESRALLPQVLEALKAFPVPEVAVVGHTDTMGAAAGNIQLGLRRANAIRALLIASGVDASLIETASHGEADPVVRTADETAEPRNRRVEITVR
jgi:outer membrane protein OmpA-like peptidoglycan-associated protein